MSMLRFVVWFALALLVLAATPAAPLEAAVLQVANNGLDAPDCGAKTAPCRSITRAIDEATAGDTIVVGPGRYGDLDRDGTLGEPNEEGPEDGALIVVDKPVTIESSSGAVWTIIDGAGFDRTAVRITASGARFGRAKRGFTLFDAKDAGVSVEETASNVVVEANLAVRTGTGFATSGAGTGALVQGNVASTNGAGVALRSAGGGIARANLAVANTANGFDAGGSGQRFEGNVATGNGIFGFSATLSGDTVLAVGAAIGNRQGVFGGTGDSFVVTGLAAFGNSEGGIRNQSTATMSVTASNLVGNGPKGLAGNLNCGTLNGTFALDASNVFWGAATGPGDDPADLACDLEVKDATTFDPFATKAFKIKTKVPAF